MSRDRPGRLSPPSGEPPPVVALLPDSTEVDLVFLAQEICRRYQGEFPDEVERYGPTGLAWCLHDNQHLLNWAALSVAGCGALDEEITWLARVLEARDFPLARLRRNLELAAAVIEAEHGQRAEAVAAALRDGAKLVASKSTFLEPDS